MLDGWHEFYGLLGTAAAALLALLFVSASIGASVLTYDRAGPTRTYLSPVVFHYSNILFLSLFALIPTQTPLIFGLTILIAAAGSFIYSIFIFVRLLTDGIADFSDRIAYGAVPIASYAAGGRGVPVVDAHGRRKPRCDRCRLPHSPSRQHPQRLGPPNCAGAPSDPSATRQS
jgi:hypothetical protein